MIETHDLVYISRLRYRGSYHRPATGREPTITACAILALADCDQMTELEAIVRHDACSRCFPLRGRRQSILNQKPPAATTESRPPKTALRHHRPIVGVDPGGRHTGIVVRAHGDRLLWHALISWDPKSNFDWYLGDVIDAITKARDIARQNPGPMPIEAVLTAIPLAVEDLNDPNPAMGIISLRGLLDTAQVIGAIAAQWTIARIPPGRHGAGPLNAYPPPLRGDREKRGAGKLRHCRAAWDIAATARTLTRQQGATA